MRGGWQRDLSSVLGWAAATPAPGAGGGGVVHVLERVRLAKAVSGAGTVSTPWAVVQGNPNKEVMRRSLPQTEPGHLRTSFHSQTLGGLGVAPTQVEVSLEKERADDDVKNLETPQM